MNTRTAYIIAAVVLAWTAWMFRYDLVGTGGGESEGIAYRLDRWTGAIIVAGPRGTMQLEPVAPAPGTDLFKEFGVTPTPRK